MPDLVVGAAIRDSSGKVIDKRFEKAYDDLDKDIVGVVSGSSLVITLLRKFPSAEEIPKSSSGFSVAEAASQAESSDLSAQGEEADSASITMISLGTAQAKSTGGFIFEDSSEETKSDLLSFSLGDGSSSSASSGFTLKTA